jgi:hypothetical protein
VLPIIENLMGVNCKPGIKLHNSLIAWARRFQPFSLHEPQGIPQSYRKNFPAAVGTSASG